MEKFRRIIRGMRKNLSTYKEIRESFEAALLREQMLEELGHQPKED